MRYSVIDCHCDTASKALDENTGFFNNDLQVDLGKISFEYTQFFAAFIAPEYNGVALDRTLGIIKKTKKEISRNPDRMVLCRDYNDYCENKGKIKAFLSLEGAEAITSMEVLEMLYDEGIRLATLTWNYSNHLAGGVLGEGGLSAFGKKVVRKMNESGIIVDVSHLNDESFWDVMEVSKKTVIASHSNSRTVCNNKRNLTDEQFFAIKKNGGVVGINLYPLFLSGEKTAEISDIIKHIEYFLSLGGENNISLGADFDGIDVMPQNMEGAWDIYKLFDEMLRLGYGEKIINKLSCTNMERILQENLCKNSKIILND